MLSKLYLGLSLVLGIGIGLIAHSAITTIASKHGGESSGHDPHATSDHAPDETRVQISRRATITLEYPPEQAIQLFTAEGETYWLGDLGWNPAMLRGDGFHKNDVFAVGNNTFIVADYDTANGTVKYARVETGKSSGIVDISISAEGSGSVVEVAYNMTGLSDDGDNALAEMTDEVFATHIASWRTAIEANATKIQNWLASRN